MKRGPLNVEARAYLRSLSRHDLRQIAHHAYQMGDQLLLVAAHDAIDRSRVQDETPTDPPDPANHEEESSDDHEDRLDCAEYAREWDAAQDDDA